MKKNPKPIANNKIPALPSIWTHEKIHSDAAAARNALIERRKAQIKNELDSLKDRQFPTNTSAIQDAIACMETCIQGDYDATICQTALSKLIKTDSSGIKREALRYLAYPPISQDDLIATADIVSLTSKTIDAKPNPKDSAEIPDTLSAKRVMETIGDSLDSVRFEWLIDPSGFKTKNQKATSLVSAKKFALESTAMMLSAQQTQTSRRSTEKSELESQVNAILTEQGFVEKQKKKLLNTSDLHKGLAYGEFMKECTVATENADFIVCLKDGRFLFIECKASNSEINSRKRLNKEATKNVQVWLDAFGNSIVGSCAIRGIFKPDYVIEAQNHGVFIFWAHNLEALSDFLKSAV
jgi:hypothetical protein